MKIAGNVGYVFDKSLKIKEWFVDKIRSSARDFNILVFVERNEKDGSLVIEDGCDFLAGNVKAESEKAYRIEFDAETVGGYAKVWSQWIPKSVIAEMRDFSEIRK